MAVRTSEATWLGNLKEGSGKMKVGPGHYEGPYTYQSRFEEGKGTNPEELIGAAHAGCFSMFLASLLANNGYKPESVHTTATVHLNQGTINKIELKTEVKVPGIDADKLTDFANQAKSGCPVSKALAAVNEVVVDAKLVS